MRDFVIMTDSCCDMTAAMAKDLELEVLPLSLNMGQDVYRNWLDGREIGFEDFYARIRAGETATTSAVSVGEFEDAMRPILAQGKDILCINFSSALSTTYQSASIAAEDVMAAHPGSKILVVDSRCASLGQGLLVYLAVQEQRRGRSIEEVRDFAEETKNHLCHWFTVDDLNHLKRGGRVSAAAAFFGTMLQMKPVLHVDDEGRLIPVSKVRGRRASIKALLEQMEELAEDTSTVFISHGDCLEEAQGLAQAIREKFPVERLEINFVGPVIGNHSGPGTLALFFLGKHK